MRGVYLLHFEKELIDYEMTKHYGDSRHYIGFSADIRHRVSQHVIGNGSQMTQAAFKQGIAITLAGIFPNAESEVEQMMTRIGATGFCPLCQVETYVKPARKKSKKWR